MGIIGHSARVNAIPRKEIVLVQREMESGQPPSASITPIPRGSPQPDPVSDPREGGNGPKP
jgi:hypothetical protein